MFWNLTKYFTVDPDSWFSNVTYEAIDSPDDGDTLPDSIRANFTINTIMPHDLTMVEAILAKHDNPEEELKYKYENYTVDSKGRTEEIIFSIPDEYSSGNYSLSLRLYNSTGRINEIVEIGEDNYNDTTESSDTYTLYHPFGYTKIGSLSQSMEDRITGSVFTINEYGIANNITAFINQNFMSPGPYKCMIYRLSDSKLIGTTTEDWESLPQGNPMSSSWWAVFNFTEPKPVLGKDTEYILTCWGDNEYSRLYYDDYATPKGRYSNSEYGNPPQYVDFTNENRIYSIYCSYTPDTTSPEITNVSAMPDTVGHGFNVTINADVTSTVSDIDMVWVIIADPDLTFHNFTMNNIGGDTYEYVFNDTWQYGQYKFIILAKDVTGNQSVSSQYVFNVAAEATINVCTIKDSYSDGEIVNLTDPPEGNGGSSPGVGYELLDDGDVLRIWNKYDSYYFNTSSGIQLTNHYDDYWSHNVLMLGYYNNDQWNLIYRTDELSGFNKDIESDNETFVNATLWKDLSYEGYDFRLAVRYHLGVDDNELTVIPYIKNLGDAIPYSLGFGWEINDIQISMTPQDDYIEINGTWYYLNTTIDETYKNMVQPCYYIREDLSSTRSKSLYLHWDENLDDVVRVKSRQGQYNAPVSLFIRIGTLSVDQEKYTELYWYDADQVTYFFDGYDAGEAWPIKPGGMVNGNENNYASTMLFSDVELCNNNTCNGTFLGAITKVELRVKGYYTLMAADIILRPVYNGNQDGDDYVFDAPSGTGQWSSWFDISTVADRWGDWNTIKNLDCDVESSFSPGMWTLYCSKVEVRVTYTSNYAPTISNPYPTVGSTGISISPLLNITVSDADGDLMNITWYSNSSGSWVEFGTNSSVSTGTYHQTLVNASVNGGWWYWNVSVNDGKYYTNSSVFYFYTGNESKIVNSGDTDFSGYLLMTVDFYNETLEEWYVDVVVVNDTIPRVINSGEQLGLDTIFNPESVNTSSFSNGNGTYRVYAAFRDPDGDVLVCDDESLLEAWWEFTVDTS